jgi:malonyl CoA-acyl carrier protein transacylase
MTTAVIFPGQGSQRKGMGEELFGRYPDVELQADSVLGYSVRELCLTDPGGRLGQTLYTQPARYVVNVLAWRAAVDDGLAADVVLGHSVGEYAALLAAQVFDFATGLRLVLSRARAMAAVPGAMSVVLGLDPARISQVLRAAGLAGIDLANLNADDQTVISGPAGEIAAAAAPLTEAGALAVKQLKVSGPFHSRYMRGAARSFAREVHACPLAAPSIPVIANRTAREYPAMGIGRLLIEQIDHQVLWAQSLGRILRRAPEATFIELGGTPTLGSTVRRAQREAGRRHEGG